MRSRPGERDVEPARCTRAQFGEPVELGKVAVLLAGPADLPEVGEFEQYAVHPGVGVGADGPGLSRSLWCATRRWCAVRRWKPKEV
jgi:hypothetical protein